MITSIAGLLEDVKNGKVTRVCFDLDDTLCEKPKDDLNYDYCTPIKENCDLLRTLFDSGVTIIIHTARGMNRFNGNVGIVQAAFAEKTIRWLHENNIPYHQIYFGKPAADAYIDDKSINPWRI